LLGYWETLSDVDVCGELQWCALCACVRQEASPSLLCGIGAAWYPRREGAVAIHGHADQDRDGLLGVHLAIRQFFYHARRDRR